MPNNTRDPLVPAATVYGWASFVHRNNSRAGVLVMNLLDGLVAAFGLLLRIGGRPLLWLLVQGLGHLSYGLSPGRRRVSLVNLDLVFGNSLSEAEKKDIVRRMFLHYMRAALESLYDTIYWPPEKLRAAIGTEGTKPLEAARSLGTGYAILTSHLGNIDLSAHTVPVHGYECFGIYKGFSNGWFDRFMGRKRLAAGINLVEVPATRHDLVDGERVKVPRSSLRDDVLQLWEKNYGLFFACDQYSRRGGIPMSFMGVPDAPMQVGALKYAVDNHKPLVFTTLVYLPGGKLKWVCEGPFPIEDLPAGPDATLRHYLERYNQWMGERIRQHPEQYAWAHRRFPRHYYERQRPVTADPPAA